MDILAKARRLESRLARTVETAVQGVVGPSARQPIEILQAVVDAAGAQVQPAGRGRRVFPFNRVNVHLAAGSRVERARFEALLAQTPSLRQRIVDRLVAAGCDARDLQVEVLYSAKPRTGWLAPEWHVDFERVDAIPTPPPEEPAAALRLELVVTAGSALRRSYTFSGGRIDIGRRADVVDQRQRLVRTNHIAFSEDGGDVNRTVSRKHAHIIYDAASREYRLKDDGSAHGTAIVRVGHTIPVPQGSRGAKLQTGDEVVLGQAKLRVRVGG